jgi:hypothetical protein
MAVSGSPANRVSLAERMFASWVALRESAAARRWNGNRMRVAIRHDEQRRELGCRMREPNHGGRRKRRCQSLANRLGVLHAEPRRDTFVPRCPLVEFVYIQSNRLSGAPHHARERRRKLSSERTRFVIGEGFTKCSHRRRNGAPGLPSAQSAPAHHSLQKDIVVHGPVPLRLSCHRRGLGRRRIMRRARALTQRVRARREPCMRASTCALVVSGELIGMMRASWPNHGPSTREPNS